MNLLKNRVFLIASAVFVATMLLTVWFLFPPTLTDFNETRAALTKLEGDVRAAQGRADSYKDLQTNSLKLNEVHDLAASALPATPSPDLLLLQLDGLAKALGLDITITVPLTDGALAVQVGSPPPAGGEVKQGSGSAGGSSQPIVTSSGSNTEFNLSFKGNFATAQTLLAKLKTFIRWNTVTGVEISTSGSETNVTISGQVFWLPTPSTEFTLPANDLLERAAKLFNGYQSYTTTPDISIEGQFGRADPFAAP